jgi:transposase/predicted nucleic acid-binding Zn finger protein
MTPREERGLVIAATQKLVQKGKVWIVPSQNGNGKYTVCPDHDSPYCSCPDFEATGAPCKHVHAVTFAARRERQTDGTIVETEEVTFTKKTTYPQNWPIYNACQMSEKDRFQELLADLLQGVEEPEQPKSGRRRTTIKDMIFAACLKVFTGFSSRRFACDLRESHERGHLSHLMHSVSVCAFLENELITPFLTQLVECSALPLRSVESTFAPDSTGFSTSRFVRWFDEKYGQERSGREWVKAHAMVGTKTNIITAAVIEGPTAADSPQFGTLVKRTVANGFKLGDVCADKAYLSHENLELVVRLGGSPFIPFKSNSTSGPAGSLWNKMHGHFILNRDQFMKRYHQRSNVESTFSMVKAKFRDSVRSKTDVAMKNEVLAKFLCHNIVVVHQAIAELGIEAKFWNDQPKEVRAVAPVTVQVAEPVAEFALADDFRFSD